MDRWSRRQIVAAVALILLPALPVATQSAPVGSPDLRQVATSRDVAPTAGENPPEEVNRWLMFTGPDAVALSRALATGQDFTTEEEVYAWLEQRRRQRHR